jgi:hypothetical protein
MLCTPLSFDSASDSEFLINFVSKHQTLFVCSSALLLCIKTRNCATRYARCSETVLFLHRAHEAVDRSLI